MLDEKAIINLGVRDALHGEFKSRVKVSVHISRWFIWLMKLRNCWAILRAPVVFEEGDETTTTD